tara:strand:+ start:3058 stop:3504 length:447 start_codon:yes stop_codon:yes gene_type:complete
MTYVGGGKAGWNGNYVESVNAAKTIDKNDSGKVFMVTHPAAIDGSEGYTITLPTPSVAGAGFSCKFIVSSATLGNDADEDVTFTDGTTDSIVFQFIDANSDFTSDIAIDTVIFDHTAYQGDFMEWWTDGTTWYVFAASGVDGGIVVST